MINISFDANADVPKHIVQNDKRMLYVMKDFMVVDPFMVRLDTNHDSFDAAVTAASEFLNNADMVK